MNITGNSVFRSGKGFVFSIDLAVAFFVLILSFYIMLCFFSEKVSSQLFFLKNSELESSAIFLADSIVKNSDENNSFYGMAFFDLEKRRVKSNEIFSKNAFFSDENFQDFFAKEVSAEFKSGEKIILFEKDFFSKNCFSVERFVLIDSKKAKLSVVVCEK